MKSIIVVLLTALSTCALAQNKIATDNFVKLTAGRIIFGTGDIFGYAINIEYAKRYGQDRRNLKHFALGAELSFEHGATHPKIINPTVEDFLWGPFYRSTTDVVLTPKITYYPFNSTFAKGLNITAGLSLGHTSQAREFQASRVYDSVSQTSVRRSYLQFKEQTLLGYRVTAGYEHLFSKILIGARLDFDSYDNGDINSFYGLTAGIRF
jgi:hypothetical protein